MAEIEITASDETTHGAYRADVEGTAVQAELTWKARRRSDDESQVRIADHTFTPPEARGKGIAFKLVEAMIADARKQGFTIKPTCPYVVDQFGKHPEWADVLAA